MKKINLIFSIAALAFTAITVVTLLYAWYITADRVDDMEFNILQIDSLVTLYEADDSNYNGVPNLSSDENINKYYNPEASAHVPYQMQYYNEKYSFNYVDQRYALSQDSSANLLNTVVIDDMAPSKIYGFKFEIINYVGLDNTLEFNFLEDNQIDTSILKDFDCRLGVVTSSSNVASVTFTEWTNFCTYSNNTYSYNGLSLNPLDTDMVIPARSGSLSVGRLDVWLQIRINPSATNDSISEFMLPYYRLTLSCDMPDTQNGD